MSTQMENKTRIMFVMHCWQRRTLKACLPRYPPILPVDSVFDGVLTHCFADVLSIEVEDLHFGRKSQHWIDHYHRALAKQDKRFLQRLSESGAIHILVASKLCCSVPKGFVLVNIAIRRTIPGWYTFWNLQ